MSIRIGEAVPDFAARSDDGQQLSLSGLNGQWAVLYFYPRASTPGCSIEAQRFEQALPEFRRMNAQVIGVSTDTEARQAKFREKCDLSFPLIPDGDKVIGRAYGVLGGVSGLLNLAQRQTFLIDPQGKLAWHWKVSNPGTHAGEVLAKLAEVSSKTPRSE
ncbi:peroxiredoxin [Deinococcus altitudinis]|uniref:peroxiredoxin n=1 Tax=Deinococcus altitudinis TaxID=468914 RepID=UPI0038920DFD